MTSSPYADKIVLVTGASSGMGKATAIYLAGKGVKAITLFARGKDRLDEVANEIKAMGTATKTLIVVGDASKAGDNQRAIDETVAAFGGINSAFVNAGVYRGELPLADTPDEAIEDVLNVNVKGVIYALRCLIPAISKTVGDDKDMPTGSIVVNSSCMGASVIAPKSNGSSIYSASKAFVNSLVLSAATENAPRIRVNGVMPGVVQTSIMPVDDATYQMLGAAVQPLYGRPGKSVEVASLVSYLISNEASFISGTNIKADGLWSLSGDNM
jgi:NAD(P)-dependent dehydrogenase (short-subunit alcohol dehydrogenase family)